MAALSSSSETSTKEAEVENDTNTISGVERLKQSIETLNKADNKEILDKDSIAFSAGSTFVKIIH